MSERVDILCGKRKGVAPMFTAARLWVSKLCQEDTESEIMARPLKDGVDYFPKDTDFYSDDKVRLLRAEFEAKGMYLLDYLLCNIYGKKGYYMEWDRNRCLLVSDGAGCGCGPGFTEEFIRGCVRCSFFDKGVFDAFGVLTSAGIQRRFIRMLNSRDNFTFIKEYFLLDISDKKDIPEGILNKVAFKSVSFKENSVKSKGNPDKSKGNSESRLKENRIDYSKEEEERKIPSSAASADKNNSEINKALKLYSQHIGKVTNGIESKFREYLKTADTSLIEYAIDEAVKYEKRSWSYISRIIQIKLAKGLKSRYDIERFYSGKSKTEPVKSRFNNYTDTNEVDYSDFAEKALDYMMSYGGDDSAGEDPKGQKKG